MATKIVLLAQDIKVGTEIVQFALASGAAIMEYGEVDSPLAKSKPKPATKKRKPAPPRRDSNMQFMLVTEKEPTFQMNSMRAEAFGKLMQGTGSVESDTRQGWIKELQDKGYSQSQSTTLIAGFLSKGALREA